MNVLSRGLTIGALLLILLSSACNFPTGTPAAVGTILPTRQVTSTVAPTLQASTETPITVIPVTGADDVSLQCQFCVNDEPHAVLVLPENAAFLVSQPVVGVNCVTAQVVGDQRIIFCRGTQQMLFTLNVCFESGNCLQYPITLATCPLAAQPANPTPVVLTPANAGITPTSSATGIVGSPPPAAATTATPSTVVATTAPPPVGTVATRGLQSRIPTANVPRTALNTPEGFLRWYFASVWNERNYQDLWDNYLTPSFKARPNAGGYEGYVSWWNSVQRVDVNSVSVLQNDGTNAWVRVNVTFTMTDGRVISNQEYDYDLFYDATRQTWMFDYRTPAPAAPTP